MNRRITLERKRIGQNQKEFADACGVSERTQQNYELGVSFPKVDYLQKAAELGVDLNYILTGEIRNMDCLPKGLKSALDTCCQGTIAVDGIYEMLTDNGANVNFDALKRYVADKRSERVHNTPLRETLDDERKAIANSKIIAEQELQKGNVAGASNLIQYAEYSEKTLQSIETTAKVRKDMLYYLINQLCMLNDDNFERAFLAIGKIYLEQELKSKDSE